jgi:hypothetical protein
MWAHLVSRDIVGTKKKKEMVPDTTRNRMVERSG